MKSLGRWVGAGLLVSTFGLHPLAANPLPGGQTSTAALAAADRGRGDEDDDAQEKAADEKQKRDDEKQRLREDDRVYQRGIKALDERQWDRALEAFTEVVKAGGARADAALYWKAYAENRLGRRSDALAALDELSKRFPASRWLNDAKALEVDVKQASGQPVAPENEVDEDLKLMAINALLNTDSERAVPMLEKLLAGTGSVKLKERALFVLSQSGSPKAREAVARIAGGQSNPDLQMKAINNLGIFGGPESRQALSDIYAKSQDLAVKRAVLRSFMVAGERGRLLTAAKGESVPELRKEAIQQLGVMGAEAELGELYQNESSPELRKTLVHAFFVGGKADRLIEICRGEKDQEVRREVLRTLGLMQATRTADFLVATYGSEKDPTTRKEILNALFVQNNAKALVEIARKETDPSLKKEVVGKLAIMHSKEATDYLVELLNK